MSLLCLIVLIGITGKKNNGEACTSDIQCKSYYCHIPMEDNGHNVALCNGWKTSGKDCGLNEECQSGTCSEGKCT